jgi:hypothetical protein
MLTKSKIQTYKLFNGDIDGWARISTKSENDITETEWTQLDQLIQKLAICKRGLGSEEFCQQVNYDLHQVAQDEAVRNAIIVLIPK